MALTAAPPRTTKTIVLAERWRRYRDTGDRAIRDELILAYSPTVKYVAGRIAARMPAHVQLADLVSYGLGGLIEAVERFDPARGIKFESYAGRRIYGAIVDELRALDWVPRAVRTEARRIEEATAGLTSRLQRVPTDAELGAELSLDPGQLDAALQRVAETRLVALDQPQRFESGDGIPPTLLATLPDPDGTDPAASADAEDLRERIAEAIKHLPEREQLVVGLYYHQDLKYAEIAKILGVSESGICRLHTRAMLHLRAQLPGEDATGWS